MSAEAREQQRVQATRRREDSRIRAERERSAETEAAIHFYPGPEWPPEMMTLTKLGIEHFTAFERLHVELGPST